MLFNSESDGDVTIGFPRRIAEISGMKIYRDLPPAKFHAQYLGSPIRKGFSANAIRFRIKQYLHDGSAEQICLQLQKKVDFAQILAIQTAYPLNQVNQP